MIIEKVFSNIEEPEEVLYSVLMTEEEVSLFSDIEQRLYFMDKTTGAVFTGEDIAREGREMKLSHPQIKNSTRVNYMNARNSAAHTQSWNEFDRARNRAENTNYFNKRRGSTARVQVPTFENQQVKANRLSDQVFNQARKDIKNFKVGKIQRGLKKLFRR